MQQSAVDFIKPYNLSFNVVVNHCSLIMFSQLFEEMQLKLQIINKIFAAHIAKFFKACCLRYYTILFCF